MLGIFLDSETSGLNPQIHKILELAFKIVDLRTGEVKFSYQTIVGQSLENWEKSDPTSLKVNGFTWDEVSCGKAPEMIAQEIIDIFSLFKIQRKRSVFICQNPSFDRTFFSQLISPDTQESLKWPYHWLDLASMYWAISMDRAKKKQSPLPWESGLSKDMIAAFYQLPPEEKPHRAMNGVSHLLVCYEAVVGFPNQLIHPAG